MKKLLLSVVVVMLLSVGMSFAASSYTASVSTTSTTLYAGKCYVEGVYIHNYSTQTVNVYIYDSSTEVLHIKIAPESTTFNGIVWLPIGRDMSSSLQTNRIRIGTSLKAKADLDLTQYSAGVSLQIFYNVNN